MTGTCIRFLTPALAERLLTARHLVVFTGAGVSAESGIPTFRDAQQGIWAKYRPEEVASVAAFRANPQLVWDWYVSRAELARKVRPNAGHEAIARLQSLVSRVTVITQNVDNLHQAAGSREVLELHGSLFRLKPFIDPDAPREDGADVVICPVCDRDAPRERCAPYANREDMAAIVPRSGEIPYCPCCGAMLRPDIVWFGEPLDAKMLEQAWCAAENCDALICIGSSLEVQPAASLPLIALREGAVVIEINPAPTYLSPIADASLSGSAANVLPELLKEVWPD